MRLQKKQPLKKRLKLSNQILIGEIRGAHGVKGLVRIAVLAENIALFDTVTSHTITPKNRHKGNLWLAHIEGINDKDAADALKGTELYCAREDLPEIDDDEIYFTDMVGMECVDENNKLVGTIIAVDNFGAGDVIEIKPPSGQSFYLSYTEQTVLSIDDKITVSLPEIV